jgi:hypothetical protein
MKIDQILGDLLDAVTGGQQKEEEHGRPNVRPASEDPYGDPADQVDGQMTGYPGGVLPASQDPMGDPADQWDGHQVLPASQDPLGDPADTWDGHQVLPASQDPLGDPADEEVEEPAGRRGGLLDNLFGR